MKEKIVKWYNQGLWTKAMIEAVHIKGKLSDEDYNEIKQLIMEQPNKNI